MLILFTSSIGISNCFRIYLFNHLYMPGKKRRIIGTCAAGGVQSICPLNNLDSSHCIIIKLCEKVCWQNISAKFDNQPDPIKHFGVMALELAKFVKINRSRSVTWIFINGSSSNFVKMFGGKISRPSLITSQFPWMTLELWPLN